MIDNSFRIIGEVYATTSDPLFNTIIICLSILNTYILCSGILRGRNNDLLVHQPYKGSNSVRPLLKLHCFSIVFSQSRKRN